MDILIIAMCIINLGAVIAIAFFVLRKSSGSINIPENIQSNIAVINSKLDDIKPITENVNDVKIELQGLKERIHTLESEQKDANKDVEDLSSKSTGYFSKLETIVNQIKSGSEKINDGLNDARKDLTKIHTNADNRFELEKQNANSISRLEAIIAGTHSKGAAGENIVEVLFAKLPAEWQERNFKVGGKTVEFALRLPNRLILPIDSKWTATDLSEQFFATEDIDERQRIKRSIEKAVLGRASEVKKYIDPNFTIDFGIAVIPDAIYDLCSGILSETIKMNIVLVSYSMLVPYLMLVFQTVLKTCQDIDIQKLSSYLKAIEKNMDEIQKQVESNLSRAITMLENSREEMKRHLGNIKTSLTGLQASTHGDIDILNE